MMIENPEPNDWKELQVGVCRIFNEIGLQAKQDAEIKTPRGKVALDVYAIDPGSVDYIQYIVECKNWESSVPQSVVHSFTTVMHEVGANIGYIVSKHGFQKGALEYLTNTNIKGVTYAEFQNHYLNVWIDRHFIPVVEKAADSLIQFTEPINSRRERYKSNLSPNLQKKFLDLFNKYHLFAMSLVMISARRLMLQIIPCQNVSIEKINKTIAETIGLENIIETRYLCDFLIGLVQLINLITEKFIAIFGEDIFANKYLIANC